MQALLFNIDSQFAAVLPTLLSDTGLRVRIMRMVGKKWFESPLIPESSESKHYSTTDDLQMTATQAASPFLAIVSRESATVKLLVTSGALPNLVADKRFDMHVEMLFDFWWYHPNGLCATVLAWLDFFLGRESIHKKLASEIEGILLSKGGSKIAEWPGGDGEEEKGSGLN